MVPFLIASLIGFLVVTAAAAIDPSTLNGPGAKKIIRRVGIPLILLLIVFILCAWAVKLSLHDELPSFGAATPNIVFGLIFGPVFAIWIGSLLKADDGKFTLAHSVIGAVLVMLFVAGLLGVETSSIVKQYANRINKVGIAGAELTFTDLARNAQRDGDQFAVKLPPGYKDLGDLPGLSNLINLDKTMDRDCEVIALTLNPHQDCIEQPAQPASSSKAKPRWTSDFGAAFARLTISGYAQCLEGVYEKTLDDDFVTDRLQPFADRLRELLPAFRLDKTFPGRAVETHLETSRTRLADLWPVFLSSNTSAAKELRLSCALLLQSFCDPTLKIPNLNDGSKTTEGFLASADKWLEEPTTEKNLDECRKNLRDQPNQTVRDGLVKIYTAFYTEDVLTGFRSRPYLAIAVAGLFFQMERYEAGLSYLYDWIQTYEGDANFGKLTPQNPGSEDYRIWYAIRARNVLYSLMDRWVAQDANTSSAVRNMHLENLRRYLELLRLFPPTKTMINNLNVRKFDFEQDGYRSTVSETRGCNDGDDGKLILTHISTGNLFAYHALRHPDYRKIYEPSVRRIVRESMNVDLSCVAAAYGSDDAAAYRSEALVLQAEVLMADAEKSKSTDDDKARDILKKAEAAAKLAVQTIYQVAERDEKKKNGGPVPFVEKISSTKALIAKETAERTVDRIKKALNDL